MYTVFSSACQNSGSPNNGRKLSSPAQSLCSTPVSGS